MSREAMQMALEALVEINKLSIGENAICLPAEIDGAMDALRQALETEQEPVAWMHTTGTGHVYFRKKPQDKVFNPQPVFTSPPKQWVGLTDEEIDYQAKKDDHAVYFALGALWAEAKLKEKNKW